MEPYKNQIKRATEAGVRINPAANAMDAQASALIACLANKGLRRAAGQLSQTLGVWRKRHCGDGLMRSSMAMAQGALNRAAETK